MLCAKKMPPKTEFVKFLGKGSFGSVDLVKYIKTDDGCSSPFYAAVKTSKSEDYDALHNEVQILSKLKGCPRIVQCYGNYTLEEDSDRDGNIIYKMVMEYAALGDLSTFMDSYKDGKLPETMIIDFTRMILQGLVYVHSLGYVHCDLKPDNILVFHRRGSFEVKISDFGSSYKVGQVADTWDSDSPWIGTSIYMSPESVHNGVAEKALDLWSLGCIVLEMYTGEKPWSEVKYDDLASLLKDKKAPEIPESLPLDAWAFIYTCFARPGVRGNRFASASGLLLHGFFHGEQLVSRPSKELKEEEIKQAPDIPPKLPSLSKLRLNP